MNINLTVRINRKKIGKINPFELKNIEFKLEKGYIMGLVGKMGAGKTSLMKCILNPQSVGKNGEILYGGHVGAIMEEMPFIYNISLKENADIFGGMYEDYSYNRFCKYLAQVELSEHKIYGNLSKGEKVKFQFAFAMSHKPSLLILDEPTSGLDAVFRREFLYLLQEAVEQEMISVIISTHLMEDLDKVADYIGYMENGEVLFVHDKESLREIYSQEENAKSAPGLSDIIISENVRKNATDMYWALKSDRLNKSLEPQYCNYDAICELNQQIAKRHYARYFVYGAGAIAWFVTMILSLAIDISQDGLLGDIMFMVIGNPVILGVVMAHLSTLQSIGPEKRTYYLKISTYYPVRKKDYWLSKLQHSGKILVIFASIVILQLIIGQGIRGLGR